MSEPVDDPESARPEVVTVGAATIDRTYHATNLPEPDGGAFAGEVTESFGGVGANVATGLARLGRDAGLIARIGEDDVADAVEPALREGPVDTERVRRKPGTSTHCIVIRDPDGERMILTAGDSTKRLRIDDDDRNYLRRADAVFATAYVPDAVTRDLLEVAAEPDSPALAFDLSGPIEELSGRGTERETIDDVVAAADCLVSNALAAASYLGVDAADAAGEFLDRGARKGAVTFGEEGATLFEAEAASGDGRIVEVPAFDVDAVDTTGAGDAFNAALVDRWLLGECDPEEAGRFAAAAAACNCRAEGARGGLATAAEVRAFLD